MVLNEEDVYEDQALLPTAIVPQMQTFILLCDIFLCYVGIFFDTLYPLKLKTVVDCVFWGKV